MTLQDVIQRLRYKADNIKAKLEPNYFSECADYLEKYRRHDLRVNPEDLPGDDGYYEIYYTSDCEDRAVPVPYMETYVKADGWMTPKGYRVIAWRVIEPLEDIE